MTLYQCGICYVTSEDGTRHYRDCPNHPDAALIALEGRVAALESAVARAHTPTPEVP